MPDILITGAGQGIGRAIARAFAAEKDARIVLISRTEHKIESVAEECRRRGAETLVLPCDVTDEKAVQLAAGRVMDSWGVPDVIINNAGVFEPGAIQDTSVPTFRYQVDSNLTSAFIVTHVFFKEMMARGSGHIFYMASVASIRPYAGGAAYCAAKHGLLGLARVVREETKDSGLQVTILMPGATFTPSWDGTDLPEARFMPPEDIARTVLDVYHLSDRSVVEEIIIRPQKGDI